MKQKVSKKKNNETYAPLEANIINLVKYNKNRNATNNRSIKCFFSTKTYANKATIILSRLYVTPI